MVHLSYKMQFRLLRLTQFQLFFCCFRSSQKHFSNCRDAVHLTKFFSRHFAAILKNRARFFLSLVVVACLCRIALTRCEKNVKLVTNKLSTVHTWQFMRLLIFPTRFPLPLKYARRSLSRTVLFVSKAVFMSFCTILYAFASESESEKKMPQEKIIYVF